MTTSAASRGFSLLELIVVIGIVLLLMGMLLNGIIRTGETKKKLQARDMVHELAAAAESYAAYFGTYPPDTGKFPTGNSPEAFSDPDAIYKYLGRKITSASGKSREPFLTMDPKFLKGPSGQTLVDPWGMPYQLDAIHTIMKDVRTGDVERIGEPYPPGTPEEQATLSVKVWSNGADTKDLTGSNVIIGKGPAPEDKDNINSWTAE